MQNNFAHKRSHFLIIRRFFNVFGLLISLAPLNMGLDYLLNGVMYSLPIIGTIQGLYTFELFTSLLGLTDQSFLASLMQIGSRIFISKYMCSYENKRLTASMFVAWGISDTLRFIYYLCPLIKKLRYLASVFLYPFGVFCEVYLMLYKRNIPSLIGFLVYIPGFYFLFSRIKRKVSSHAVSR
ncbi:very-long-chain (3R)-3-hydroxyacyl-CoA dehydratase [Nematocida sp. LUAm3]|nr:very-long-chain (3R)-3-hydroxyacyl-CoA dehydratase [Nematocida sp. LUAm3]KAI5173702.1 very-long-chain (3R)-3-hydroxyacyl-CoA dehydratase [Nematocida sp. LUAm2]KAI5176924.1 very-long-chain (3R)-3-hydroxyacyl-CoA dehydratase [Nematocida sp. LUAm1]